ncbi:hypothetical protein SBY92_000359 [Candida maltosa Xu316]
MSKNIPNQSDVIDSIISDTNRQQYQDLLTKYNDEKESHWEFSVVPGIFKQSLEDTDETKFDTIKEHFGIIPTWDEVINQLNTLNANVDSNKIQYKHGQGFHNVKHTENPELWDSYWSHLNTDGKIVWAPDPELTDLGIQQAKDNNAAWKTEIVNNKQANKDLIVPTRFYTSPFRRSVDTLINTWDDIVDLKQVKPYIQEDWRETIGEHTCDMRSNRSTIAEKYESKGFEIEPGFEEEDIYWKPDYRETVPEQAVRQNNGFQELFNNYPNDQIVSITSHSGSIRTQLLVLGHRPFAVGTGGMIPVFVKAVKV